MSESKRWNEERRKEIWNLIWREQLYKTQPLNNIEIARKIKYRHGYQSPEIAVSSGTTFKRVSKLYKHAFVLRVYAQGSREKERDRGRVRKNENSP